MLPYSIQAGLIVVASLAIAVSASPSLSLRITGSVSVHNVDNFKVKTVLTNTGGETVKVLNDPRGPLSIMPTDTFNIISERGDRPVFTGVKVKYVPSTAATSGAYTVLAPGQAVEVEHKLADAYNFTTPGEGSYDITARNLFYIVDDIRGVIPIYADVGPHAGQKIKLSGQLFSPRLTSTFTSRERFTTCSSTQQSGIEAAAKSAQIYAGDALAYLQSHGPDTKRFTTWFGSAAGSENHDTVTSHYSRMSAAGYSTLKYDCSCTDNGVYAYVYADQYGTIYLCGAFWNAKNTGTDSRAGTLIHESSHFTENGGTGDYAYGEDNAKSLAIDNPSKAIFNADSHEYFAENQPALD